MQTGVVVAEIMTRKPITIPRNISVRTAAQLMKEKRVGSLLVVENNELQGILTKSDIIKEVVAEAKNPQDIRAEDIMTRAVITTKPHQDVFDALVLMKDNDVRHLPVLDEEALAGFVTIKDIIKINPALLEIVREDINLREEERKLRAKPFEPQEL